MNTLLQRWAVSAFAALSLVMSCPSFADEALFGYTYGADTLPQGEFELQTAWTHRWNKGRGHFRANELQTEFEYGVTNRFTTSAYLLFLDIDHSNAFPIEAASGDVLYPDRNGFFFRGAKLQFKYNILSPYLNEGWGLAAFLEPQYITRFRVDGSKTRQYEAELGVVVQKNLLDDQLVLAYNLVAARERRVLVEDDNFVEHEWEFTNTLGASYRVAPRWNVGFEARHHMDVLRNPDTDRFEKNQYSFFVGPTVHYANQRWWVTGTFFAQVQGNPTYARSVLPVIGGVDSNLHLDENEKYEFRMKFGYEF